MSLLAERRAHPPAGDAGADADASAASAMAGPRAAHTAGDRVARSRTRRRRSVLASALITLLVAGGLTLGQASPSSMRDAETMTTSQLSAGQRYVAGEVADITRAELESAGLASDDIARAQKIVLMTALQESSLRNLNHGDADSQGLFQQRPSMGWGDIEQVRDPQWAVAAFLGTNDAVENPGLLDVANWRTMSLNDAAQEVQRSNHPEQYGRWEALATSLLEESEVR